MTIKTIKIIFTLIFCYFRFNLYAQNEKEDTDETKINPYLSLLINGSIKTNLSTGNNIIGTGSIGARYVSKDEEITGLISINEASSEQTEDSVQSFGDVVLIQAIRSGSFNIDYKKFYKILDTEKYRFGIGANISANFSSWKVKTGVDSENISKYEKKKALILSPNLNVYYRILSLGFTSSSNSKEGENAESKLKAQKELQKEKEKFVFEIKKQIDSAQDSSTIKLLEKIIIDAEESDISLTSKEIKSFTDKLNAANNRIDITVHLGLISRFVLGNIGFDDTLRSKALDGNFSKFYYGLEVGMNIEINNFNAFFNIPYLLPGNDRDINVRGLTRGQPVAGIEFRGDIWKIVNIK